MLTQESKINVGHDTVPNTVCATFASLKGENIVQGLDLRGVCISSGAACASGSLDPSPVLSAMGAAEPASSIRLSLGPQTTRSEVEEAMAHMSQVLDSLRTLEAF